MRDGISIQERTCPWCRNRLTGRLGDKASVCFNCRHTWRGESPLERRRRRDLSEPTLPASAVDQPRWRIYRAALQAGFYTDWPARR